MRRAIEETERRREIQIQHNIENNIKPTTIKKAIRQTLDDDDYLSDNKIQKLSQLSNLKKKFNKIDGDNVLSVINELEKQMYNLAKDLEFEKAAKIRDQISDLQRNFLDMPNRQKS